jgi:hypothetical protein
MRLVSPAYGMAVKGGATGDHVPHEVGALLLEGSDDDCSHMLLLHRTLDNTKTTGKKILTECRIATSD